MRGRRGGQSAFPDESHGVDRDDEKRGSKAGKVPQGTWTLLCITLALFTLLWLVPQPKGVNKHHVTSGQVTDLILHPSHIKPSFPSEIHVKKGSSIDALAAKTKTKKIAWAVTVSKGDFDVHNI